MFSSLSHIFGICSVATFALGLFSIEALAQPYGPGPAGTLPGTSMAGARIIGAPTPAPGIQGARIFGDTNAERRFGRAYDDSYLRPKVVQPESGNSAARRAVEGRSDLNGISAGTFAREGATAIGRSSVTRGRSMGRRLVVPEPKGHPARGGRAIIRR
ncbi:hypothetical protein [Fulvimarina sp. MAC8]|uniref:hypothetical protein n=1 Tax=Fulvimarina sp. MAC8 TaxID=3162874 RepID=UPI0032EF7C78